jgi:hypothetical protein
MSIEDIKDFILLKMINEYKCIQAMMKEVGEI